MNKQQLASCIWAAANKLRGKIEANEYKDYILGLIFYKFLSDTEVQFLTEKLDFPPEEFPKLVETSDDPDITAVIEECRNRIGFFIDYKNLFSTWLATNEFDVSTLSNALRSFDRLMSEGYRNVYGGIFDTIAAGLNKLGNSPADQTRALKQLIALIRDIPTNGTEDYDVLGYVYEYLISKFAANAGKKAGEFYTPHEVAMLMSEIVADHHKDHDRISIYDPTSGSGSLLITIGKAVGKHMESGRNITYYAQELKENTYNLTRMNLVMRGIIPQNILTRCADSLEEDWPIKLQGSDIGEPLAVDAVVSNPPYSQHWSPKDKEYDPRFAEYGVAPKTKADYAFLLHELHHLKHDGIMTIVLPHGVLFRGKATAIYDADGSVIDPENREEGQGEGIIRSKLIEKNNIDAIIGLPAGIFFGTGIPTLIMILKKNRGEEGIMVIDASKGFVKDGTQNKLRASDIKRIADTYKKRRTIPGYSREVTRDEIRRNDYNLNIPRYVDSSEKAEQFDIYSTMFGGLSENEIDSLARYWEVFPSLRGELFTRKEDTPYHDLAVADVKDAIHSNADVKTFKQTFGNAFGTFRDMMKIRLIDHVEDVNEVAELDHVADDIMHRCSSLPLVDPYAVYQILSDHWNPIMTDIEIIQSEGYKACNEIETAYKIVTKNDEEMEVADGIKGRIMPFDLVQRTCLSSQLNALNALRDARETAEAELTDILEGLDAEEQDLLLNDDNTKFDSKSLTKMFNQICDDREIGKGIKRVRKAKKEELFLAMELKSDSTEEKLQRILSLQARSTKLKKEIAEAEKQLEITTVATIEALDMNRIVELLQLKWIDPIASAIEAIPDEVLGDMAASVEKLTKKYAVTYTDVEHQLQESRNALSALIDELAGDDYAIEGLKTLVNPKCTAEIARLRQVKTASLQAMFPQEGETVPRLRFKGFEGEWKPYKIGKIGYTYPGITGKTKGDFGSGDAKYIPFLNVLTNPIINTQNLEAVNIHPSEHQNQVQKDDLFFNTSSETPEEVGMCAVLTEHLHNTYLNSFCFGYRVTDPTIWPMFLAYLMRGDYARKLMKVLAQGATRFNLSKSNLMESSILLASSLEEQRKIADFFVNLDRQIELAEKKLEKLKQIKASCLDLMLV